MSKTLRAALLATTAFALIAPAAHAQEEGVAVQELVVTAQKREERLQEVPVAISALPPERIEKSGVEDVTALNGFVPNLQVRNSPGLSTGAAISMRGGVTINPALSFEPTVAIYVDGAYVGKTQGGVFDVVDLERIEVLRGPQGTLYGRNTMGGAISLVTRRPTGVFGGDLRASVGDWGYKALRGRIDLPAFGDLKVKVAFNRQVRDGFVDVVPNPFPGVALAGAPQVDEVNNLDSASARIAAEYEPRDDLRFNYSYDFSRNRQRPQNSSLKSLQPGNIFDPASPFYIGAPTGGGNYAGFPLDLYVAPDRPESVSLDSYTFESVKIHAHTLTGQWEATPNLTLKSITAYREAEIGDQLDLDGSPLPLAHTSRLSTYESFSQELQAVGDVGNVNYVAGLYYFQDDGFTNNPQSYFGGAQVFDSRFGFATKAYAVYGQLDWKPEMFADKVKLSLGGRYTHEEKTGDRFNAVVGGPVLVPPTRTEVDFDSFTPMVTLAYEPTDTLNFYVRYAEGFKSGGINGEAGTEEETRIPYDAETVDSVELGAKTSLLDRRLQLNVALFRDKHKDMQLSVFTATGAAQSVIRNAGSAIIQGIELEAVARPTSWLNVQATWGYLDTEYEEFIDAGVNVANNRAFPYAARNTASLTADATLAETSYGAWNATVSARYTSRFFGYPYPLQSNVPGDPGSNSATTQNAYNTEVKGYTVVDARLALDEIPLGAGLEGQIALWARNLLDEEYENVGIDFGTAFGGLRTAYYGDPRTVGVDFTVKW
jgi:iron complex outermembrane recepter protein